MAYLYFDVHVKTNCKHFTWKTLQLIDWNKINQNMLKQPYCDINKLTRFLSCSEDCRWFEKDKKRSYT